MNDTTKKVIGFFSRWKIWIVAALVMLAALSASRRATRRQENATDVIRAKATASIDEGWTDVDADVADFLDAQDKGQKANEKLSKQLDRFAESDDSAGAVISDWNAANRRRLHNDADAS